MARCKHCSGVMLSERPHASLVDCLSSAQTEIATLRAELDEAKAAIDAVLNLYPNLENYIDSARRDAK